MSILILQLKYDGQPTAKTLKYDVVLENTTFTDIPNEFGQSTLVIDAQVIKSCLTVVNAGC